MKFSNDRVDLLAYAEHNQAFHIVDARRYDTRQTVQACSQNQGISGITFCPEVRGSLRACFLACFLAPKLASLRVHACAAACTALTAGVVPESGCYGHCVHTYKLRRV